MESEQEERKRLLKKLKRIRREKKKLNNRSTEIQSNDIVQPKRKKMKKNNKKKKRNKKIFVLEDDDDDDDDDDFDDFVDIPKQKLKEQSKSKKRQKFNNTDTVVHNTINNNNNNKKKKYKRRKVTNQLFVQPTRDSNGSAQTTTTTTTTNNNKTNYNYKKTSTSPKINFKNLPKMKYRRVEKKKKTPSMTTENVAIENVKNDQWIDKYKPNTIDLLKNGVNKKKVTVIENWILNAVQRKNVANRVLLLTGPSGVGKSTIVDVLSQELNINIREWRDNASDGTLDFKGWERLRLFSKGTGHNNNNNNSMSNISYGQARRIPQTEDLRRFLVRSKRYQALNLVPVQTNSSRSNNNNNNNNNNARSSSSSSIILLEYLPSPNKNNSYDALHNVLNEFLKYKKGSPLIIVYSGSNGSHPAPSELKKVFSSEFLSSNAVKEIQCRPIPTSGMKRVLKEIASCEKLEFDSSVYENIVEQSNGDLRHGIILLQYYAIAGKINLKEVNDLYDSSLKTNRNNDRKKKRKDENTNVTTKSTSKDIAYDMLHNIGKLLYAKREEGTRNLQYDPDVVISSTGMNPMLVGSFLSQNAGSFYSDIDDLGELSSLLSDVDLLSQNEREISFGHGQISKSESQPISSSLVARAISTTNLKPAKWKFTRIVRPQTIGIEQNVKNNLSTISTTFGNTTLSEELRTDILPHLAKMIKNTSSYYSNTLRINNQQERMLKQLSLYRGMHDPGYSTRIGTLDDAGEVVGRWKLKY